MKRLLLLSAAFFSAACGSALAQRADDNAVTSADDAFGTTVGYESVGLYGAQDARGFSPTQAGNVELKGCTSINRPG